jgi:hypothetical protein
MTAIVYPREFAADTVWASGAQVGTDTKTDPTAAAEAQGLIAGLPYAAAHYNYSVNKISVASRWSVEQALLTLVPLFPEDAAEIGAEAFDGLGVAIVNEDEDTILVKGGPNGVWKEANGRVSAWGVSAGGAVSPCAVAGPNSFGEVVIIDETNGRACPTTDAGVSWSSGFAGTAHTSPGVVYDPVPGSARQRRAASVRHLDQRNGLLGNWRNAAGHGRLRIDLLQRNALLLGGRSVGRGYNFNPDFDARRSLGAGRNDHPARGSSFAAQLSDRLRTVERDSLAGCAVA